MMYLYNFKKNILKFTINLNRLSRVVGCILTPDYIIINEKTVTWKNRNKMLIGVNSISIALDKTSIIELDENVWGVHIFFHSFGGNSLFARCFRAADAKKIRALLTNNL